MFREVTRDKRQIMSRERCDDILKKSTSGVLCVLGDRSCIRQRSN